MGLFVHKRWYNKNGKNGYKSLWEMCIPRCWPWYSLTPSTDFRQLLIIYSWSHHSQPPRLHFQPSWSTTTLDSPILEGPFLAKHSTFNLRFYLLVFFFLTVVSSSPLLLHHHYHILIIQLKLYLGIRSAVYYIVGVILHINLFMLGYY